MDLSTQSSTKRVHEISCEFKKGYSVEIAHGIIELSNVLLSKQIDGRKALIIVDSKVYHFYESVLQAKAFRLSTKIKVLECNESNKFFTQVEKVISWAIEHNLDRQSVLVGIGGGVLTDVIRMAACHIRRGIAHICIPTSLVGQVDASIGVKAAVNFQNRKSYLGSYVPPEIVYVDIGLLRTLPRIHLIYGLAEIIKIAIVLDCELLDLVDEHCHTLISSHFSEPYTVAERVIFLSAKHMLEELEANIFENRTYERLVDFGHTFSPILESVTDWQIHHGQAVAIDMALSATISYKLGFLLKFEYERIVSSIIAIGLPIYSKILTADLCKKALLEASLHRGGFPNLVIPTKIGSATFLKNMDDLSDALLTDSLNLLFYQSTRSNYAVWSK